MRRSQGPVREEERYIGLPKIEIRPGDPLCQIQTKTVLVVVVVVVVAIVRDLGFQMEYWRDVTSIPGMDTLVPLSHSRGTVYIIS